VVAKGLGAGYQPIGAMLCSGRIYAAIEAGSGFFQHGHTYLAHATACAGALAVLGRLVDDRLVQRSAAMGETLDAALQERFGNHPHVGDIRGRGLFRGLEIVTDRASKQPFAPERAINARIKKLAMEEGLLCYPMGGTVDGRLGDHVLVAPPFIVSESELGELVDKLDRAIMRALA
jgi:adenosylmethionine-8-amino-7-oxononanoate aminotransferase